MSREPDAEGWILVAVALVVGILAGWLIVFHRWNENVTRAAAYTVGIFVLLGVAPPSVLGRPFNFIGVARCVSSIPRYFSQLPLHTIELGHRVAPRCG